jgi:repressor LexA
MRNVRLSKIQKQIFDYVKESINDRGYPPAVREICEAVSLKSTSSVHSHLETLEEKGYIRKDPTKPRTIEIIDDCFQLTRRDIVKVPIIGTVAAGQPLYAEENIENYYPIPSDLLPNAETFMLKIRGSSMINAGILEGDQIIVEQCPSAENGDIVVALVGDSATVKRFFKEDGYYRLQPENDSMDPIIVDHVEILGKVIGLLRPGIH